MIYFAVAFSFLLYFVVGWFLAPKFEARRIKWVKEDSPDTFCMLFIMFTWPIVCFAVLINGLINLFTISMIWQINKTSRRSSNLVKGDMKQKQAKSKKLSAGGIFFKNEEK